MSTVLRIAETNFAVPQTIVNALPQWWQEMASAFQVLGDDAPILHLAVPYGVDDRVMLCDDEEDTPAGWWARFRLRALPDGAVELADSLDGQRYDVTTLCLFMRGLLAPDAFDSLEILQITQDLHLHLYGCHWESMPAFGKVV